MRLLININSYRKLANIDFLITLLITPQIRHAGMPFLSVFTDRADGSNPTAPVIKKP
jgi:hypothetical protein